jgi:hypothetical protein
MLTGQGGHGDRLPGAGGVAEIDRSKGRLMLTGGEAAAVEHEKAEGAAVDNDDRAERP